MSLWKALRSLSVLDPTCGSGAFLFAALEILEPLYEGLLERLRALQMDWQSSGEKHPVWQKDINAILALVDRHPNEAYFIHKTIIVHNLYGVDIMEEAVEICKLRLFLKLAAQLEPGQAVEPLPDIDFNVRSGNTLVGYASRAEIQRAFAEAGGSGQMMLQGIETSLDDFRRIMEGAEDADRLFQQFQNQQDLGTEGASAQLTAKQKLGAKLDVLRLELDQFLAAQYDQRNTKTDAAFKKWKASHEPFHWFIEFYGIMNSGGFDVIVGNPPYVEYKQVKSKYTVFGYKTESCGDLYAYTMERAYRISSNGHWIGMIVPISIFGLDGFSTLQTLTRSSFSNLWCSFYSNRPSQLFDGAQKRLTILVGQTGEAKPAKFFTSRYYRWSKPEFDNLVKSHLVYEFNPAPFAIFSSSLEKIGTEMEARCFKKIIENSAALEVDLQRRSAFPVYYTRKFGYFLAFLDSPPKVRSIQTGAQLLPTELKEFWFCNAKDQGAAIAALSSSCFFWFWNIVSDCRNLNRRDLTAFPWAPSKMESETLSKLSKAGLTYLKKLKATSREMEKSGLYLETFEYRKSKQDIDQIDTILAEHYSFTPEELDFIINYDIKYRMGLGSGVADEGEDEE